MDGFAPVYSTVDVSGRRQGGAIAHDHPIGASCGVLATRLMHSMKRDRCKRGIVTLCLSGGQGIALALEML